MNLDSIIFQLETLIGEKPLLTTSRRVQTRLLVAAVEKLIEARAAFDHLVRDMDEDDLTGCIGNRASNFLCAEWRETEEQYCDGCACRVVRGAAYAVEAMPTTVGDATRGESATLCRACYGVSVRKGGAR